MPPLQKCKCQNTKYLISSEETDDSKHAKLNVQVGRMLHKQLKYLLEKDRLPEVMVDSESSDSDVNEILNVIKHQKIREKIREKNAYSRNRSCRFRAVIIGSEY